MSMLRTCRLVFAVGGMLLWAGGVLAQAGKPEVTDAATRLAWHAQHLKMRDESPWKNLRWRPIGPQKMSGRVTDIAAVSGEPYTYFVATASGGLWKTVNEGTTWQAVFDDAPSASTGAVAVAPSQPATVWVGLGEANIFRSSMSGTGVYKSIDGGEHWQAMGLAEAHHIARIVVHPSDPNIVYVAASGHEWTPNEERGVYKTTDGGATWGGCFMRIRGPGRSTCAWIRASRRRCTRRCGIACGGSGAIRCPGRGEAFTRRRMEGRRGSF